MKKNELRKIFRKKRMEIPVEEKLKLDDLLLIQFQSIPYNNVEYVFSYFPRDNYKEPDTLLFTRYLSHFINNLKIAYPVTHLKTATMEAVLAEHDAAFKDNIYGISEPVGGKVIPPETFDMIFVPLLCFDKKGYRVGYGGGYYDKFLVNCRHNATKIGFSYFEATDSIDDVEVFDVPLNYCITPQGIYEF